MADPDNYELNRNFSSRDIRNCLERHNLTPPLVEQRLHFPPSLYDRTLVRTPGGSIPYAQTLGKWLVIMVKFKIVYTIYLFSYITYLSIKIGERISRVHRYSRQT